MKNEEIICTAREAGFQLSDNATDESIERFERFAALVAAHEAEKWKAENKRDYENWKMAAEKAAECEREACAKVCDESATPRNDAYLASYVLKNCAAAIRARG